MPRVEAVRIDPALFDSVEEGTEALLSEWLVAPGAVVEPGRVLGVAELVKASVDIVAPVGGRVQALAVPAGDTFAKGSALAWLAPV